MTLPDIGSIINSKEFNTYFINFVKSAGTYNSIETTAPAFAPIVSGNFTITKHISLNDSIINLNHYSDIYINNDINDFKIQHDLNSTSINTLQKEITPRYEYFTNKSLNSSEIKTTVEDCVSGESLQKYNIYSKYGKVYYTLPPIDEEKIIDNSHLKSHTHSYSIILSKDDIIKLKDISLNIHASNDVGEICNSLDMEYTSTDLSPLKFDSINVSTKDFNIKSGSDYKSDKKLVGSVKDIQALDYMSETFRPYFNEQRRDFFIRYQFHDTEPTKVVSLFDNIVFDDIELPSTLVDDDYHDVGLNPMSHKNFFKFIPSGIHRVGVREIYGDNNDIDIITYETKYVNMVDYKRQGMGDYLYKNMLRPLLITQHRITKEDDVITNVVETKILPRVVQSYKFDKDYILKSIKPYFEIPNLSNNLNETIAIYFGFLINGKLHENGIIHTELVKVKDLSNKDYVIPYPIHIPANRDFFIGFLAIPSSRHFIANIKYIENGKYDKNGFLMSFPESVETKLLFDGNEIKNTLAKIDLTAHVYNTYENQQPNLHLNNLGVLPYTYNKQDIGYVQMETIDYDIPFNRVMFFNNDIIPNNTTVDYRIGTSYSINGKVQYNYKDLETNNEIVFPNLVKSKYHFNYRVKSTNKYVSPIIKFNEHNYLLKKYEQHKKKAYIIGKPELIGSNIIHHENVDYTGSSFKIKLRNLDGIYKAESYDDFIRNGRIGYDGKLDKSTFMIRLVFDYFQFGKEDKTYMGTYIPVNVKATNVLSGATHLCYTSSVAFKKDNYINNPAGITSTDTKLGNGWVRKTIELIPFLYEFGRFIQINRLENWEFEIEIILENTDDYSTIVKNISASVDTLMVDIKSPSTMDLKPIDPVNITSKLGLDIPLFIPPNIISVTPDIEEP